MKIIITSRHFKAHESIQDYAESAVLELSRFYDGIVKANVVLSYERPRQSEKIAEIVVGVVGTTLSGKAKSEDFLKSIDLASAKVLRQVKKYKDKLRAKNRKKIIRIREKV